jgi:haloalkane dehalogenase
MESGMQRRRFIETMTGALAGGGLVACASRLPEEMQTAGAGGRQESTAARFHEERRYLQTSFGRIAYIDRGSGDAVLFLHGFPLNSFQWRGAIDRLSVQRRCIAPDFLGVGYTEAAEGQSVAPDAQAAMLVALLDRLSLESVDIIASDSGGAVAQLFMVGHQDRVRTLLLTNCDTEPDSPPPSLLPVIELAKQGKFVDEWLVPWQADKELARSSRGLGGLCYSDPAQPTDEAIDYYLTPLIRNKALVHAYVVALDPNPLAGIEPALKRCTVPTRIVWGTRDVIFARTSADYLDRTLGNSRGVRRLDGSKLFWPEERPDVVAEEARQLWGLA